MFGRKAKPAPPQEPGRRQVQRGGNLSPAFSYYASRVSEGPIERPPARKEQTETAKDKPKSSSRSLFAGVAFWLLLILFVVCAGKLLLLSNDPKIVIVGRTTASNNYLKPAATYEAAAQKLLSGSVSNRSKLTVDPNGVSKALAAEFPELQAVSMSIPLASNRPVLYVQPAVPSLILQTLHGNYALNKNGLVLSRLDSLPSGIAEVVDQSGLAPVPGKQLLPSSTVQFVETVAFQMKAAQLTVSAFVLPAGAPYELDARLDNHPFVVRFNLQADALTQSGAAVATIEQLGSTVPANYVDVRVPGRVYYK